VTIVEELQRIIVDILIPGGLLFAFITGLIPGFVQGNYSYLSLPIGFYYALIPLAIAYISDIHFIKEALPLTGWMDAIFYFGLGLAAGFLAVEGSLVVGGIIGAYMLVLHLTLLR